MYLTRKDRGQTGADRGTVLLSDFSFRLSQTRADKGTFLLSRFLSKLDKGTVPLSNVSKEGPRSHVEKPLRSS